MTEGGPGRGARILVVMGVSGSGKTAVGLRAAARMGWRFIEGDDLHPPANVAKMRAGKPLTDHDRAPWLDAVCTVMDGVTATAPGAVVACSALRRAYRDTLRAGRPHLSFVLLDVPVPVLRGRVATRHHAFMPPSLLESQLATLEPFEPDEPGVVVDAAGPIDAVVDAVLAALGDDAPGAH